MTTPLTGRSSIITGASQGLGYEITKSYVRAGANVLLCAREANALRLASEALKALCSSDQRVVTVSADVSKDEDVDRVVRLALDSFGVVQILVNNAGVYGPKGTLDEVDWDEWKHAIDINLLGSVRMCRALLPHFRQQRYGKIIQLSGGGATNPLPRISAYAASKAAIVRFAETLAEEVRDCGIDVNSIAPGSLNTRLLDEVLKAGPEKIGRQFYERSLKQKQDGGTPTSKGAELAVFLASPASDGITGKLLSALWDPWPHLADHQDDLNNSDVYTLRRIVPKDRGMTWGG